MKCNVRGQCSGGGAILSWKMDAHAWTTTRNTYPLYHILMYTNGGLIQIGIWIEIWILAAFLKSGGFAFEL